MAAVKMAKAIIWPKVKFHPSPQILKFVSLVLHWSYEANAANKLGTQKFIPHQLAWC